MNLLLAYIKFWTRFKSSLLDLFRISESIARNEKSNRKFEGELGFFFLKEGIAKPAFILLGYIPYTNEGKILYFYTGTIYFSNLNMVHMLDKIDVITSSLIF